MAEEREATVEHYRAINELCAEWGAGAVVYLPGWVVFGTRRRKAWAWLRECLARVADDAAQTDSRWWPSRSRRTRTCARAARTPWS
ncbi:hypothetical protein [Lentzea sp. E54]|uniref:hypothetical protein n=1 Tax=Lentzea xerophila TaxID=3435883 RepID=UPI003DA24B15